MRIISFPILAALLFVAGCERLETAENRYPDIQAAIDAGAVARGWIPLFMPSSSKEIHEKHNLDTNEIWLRFTADAEELDVLEKSCQRIERVNVTFPRKRAGDWWPEALAGNQLAKEQPVSLYTYYRCDDDGLIAIDRESRMIYYWRLG